MSSSNCCFLTWIQISQEAGQVVWYSHVLQNFPQFTVNFHSLFPHSQRLRHSQSSRNRCFSGTLLLFRWSKDVGNLISGSSAFSKTSLNIWKFTFHILLKPGLENFEHYFTSVWDECNCMLVRAFFGIAFFGTGMKIDLFQSCGHCWVFQICWHIECSTFTASSFRIWNNLMSLIPLKMK